MNTLITLGIERMEIDWGKNNVFNDHSALSMPNDIKSIPYYYVEQDTDKIVIEYKEGYSRKLSSNKKKTWYVRLYFKQCKRYIQ